LLKPVRDLTGSLDAANWENIRSWLQAPSWWIPEASRRRRLRAPQADRRTRPRALPDSGSDFV